MEPNEYRTSDLYYAAFLKTAEVPFIDNVQEKDPETGRRRTVFIFERIEGIRDLKKQYFRRTAKVPALPYAQEIQALKGLTRLDD